MINTIENNWLEKDSKGVGYKQYLRKLSILKYLYTEGKMPKRELSNRTRMSPPTVNKLIEELQEIDLIKDYGLGEANQKGGPRPTYYGINPDSRYIIAIDVETYNTKIAIFNLTKNIVGDVKNIKIKIQGDTEKIIQSIASGIEMHIDSLKINKTKIIGAGIALKGLVNYELGESYTYLTHESKSTKELFEEKLKIPVVIENDARVMALAESQFGLAQNISNVLCLNVNWGLGLGIIVNDKLYNGNDGLAGEFGHIQVEKDGLLCDCGMIGCLETVASGNALHRLAIEGLRKKVPTRLEKIIGNDFSKLDIQTIIETANQGDQFATSLLSDVGYNLGRGISYLLHIFNPEKIIIGGVVSLAGKYILDPVNYSLNQYSMAQIRNKTDVQVSKLGKKSVILGAYAVFIRALFAEIENVEYSAL